MTIALDASAATALLFSGDGAEVVRAAIADDEAQPCIHLVNLIEVFYFVHRRKNRDRSGKLCWESAKFAS